MFAQLPQGYSMKRFIEGRDRDHAMPSQYWKARRLPDAVLSGRLMVGRGDNET
jgi:hypothetical protein